MTTEKPSQSDLAALAAIFDSIAEVAEALSFNAEKAAATENENGAEINKYDRHAIMRGTVSGLMALRLKLGDLIDAAARF